MREVSLARSKGLKFCYIFGKGVAYYEFCSWFAKCCAHANLGLMHTTYRATLRMRYELKRPTHACTIVDVIRPSIESMAKREILHKGRWLMTLKDGDLELNNICSQRTNNIWNAINQRWHVHTIFLYHVISLH